MNCSTRWDVRLMTSSTCVTLYHYRGDPRSGYFFKVEVIAGEGEWSRGRHVVVTWSSRGRHVVVT